MNYAPLVLFTYKRLDTLKQTISALQKNYLATESDIYIFSDAAKGKQDFETVTAVRNYLKSVSGFKSITIYEAPVNKGLAKSIIEGITQILENHETVIVLEDDLILTANFLTFMNKGLDFYQTDDRIFSISGYGFKINPPKGYNLDVYLYGRSSSWGWATWRNRWETVDWEVRDWNNFSKNRIAKKAFNKNGSDMFSMLKSCMEGKNSSWAIRFCYNQFKQGKYTIYPFLSKVDNIGFDNDATNCKQFYSRFKTKMDIGDSLDFHFDKSILPNSKIEKDWFHYQSISIRIFSKIMSIFNKYLIKITS
jgi:hypothetical protein